MNDEPTEHGPPDGANGDPPGPGKHAKTAGGNSEVLEAAFAGLTFRQGQAVEALLREPTVARAAVITGIGVRCLRRWMLQPRFKAALLSARREAFSQAVGLSQKYAPVAVATLVKVMQDPTVSPSAKIAAAALLLRFGREGIDLDDVLGRVEALERAAWGGKGPVVGRQGGDDGVEDDGDERPDDEQERDP